MLAPRRHRWTSPRSASTGSSSADNHDEPSRHHCPPNVTAVAERLVVIGGDAGGMTAASQVRARRDLDIVVFERGNWTSYRACGIPYVVGGEVGSLDELVVRRPRSGRIRSTSACATRSSASTSTPAEVEVRDHNHDRNIRLGFDQALVARAARRAGPTCPASTATTSSACRRSTTRAALLGGPRRERCDKWSSSAAATSVSRWPRRSSTAARRSRSSRRRAVMGSLDPDMAARSSRRCVAPRHRRAPGRGSRGSSPAGSSATAERSADLVVLGLGVTPNAALAAKRARASESAGSIAVDRRQQTCAEGVWAAGDCCRVLPPRQRSRVHIALGTVANQQVRVAGINIGGGYATFPGRRRHRRDEDLRTPRWRRTGLNEREAAEAGFVFRARSSRRRPGPATSRGRKPHHREAARRAGERRRARRPDRRRGGRGEAHRRARHGRSPPAWTSSRWSTSTSGTRRRSHRSGIPCWSRPA